MAWSRACSVLELEDDKPFSAEVGDELVALVRHEGELFAIRDECSHGRVMLSLGEVDERTIECFAHGSRFDLRTGEPLELPATRPVPVYPVNVEGDDVLVDLDNPLNSI
ncbi:MAG TPA: non-heme iron oxygenase ferredoxin subunit [Propionibacterium sp.]|nr:non-heme iron oxygenase ferredoxin subunit [Intrasporangiaceae bacterium]HHU38427.1 non-heme iron oxygenase ferredoxin subunit [Propionibacterium sp.]